MKSIWAGIKQVALTDVGVLVRGLDREAIDDIERVLAEADFGAEAFEIAAELEAAARGGELNSAEEMRAWLGARIAARLGTVRDEADVDFCDDGALCVILLVGVNGAGKTTLAAKLGHRLIARNRSVLLAAADTYRTGAADQLRIWAERIGADFVSGVPGGDPAAVAFDAVAAAAARGVNTVIIDTAGRLHTRNDLMEELTKVARVVGRKCAGAPHETFLVIDGTVGRNAIEQGRVFSEHVPLTGVIVTKLDGTAKGGAVVSIPERLGVPIRFVSAGEGVGDLGPFETRRFVDSLLSAD
ncbi:MAG: signal recognition particle-docking protein FtsY [Gemmatimonadales bacterium]